MSDALRQETLDRAVRSAELVRSFARVVDRENRFPFESIHSLREQGLICSLVPSALGGRGIDLATFAEVAALLAEACPSTALIWAMHGQQVDALAHCGGALSDEALRRVVDQGELIASVTSEFDGDGSFFSAKEALELEEGALRLRRRAPIVSYGAHARLFLVKARASNESSEREVRLVLVRGDDGRIEVTGEWHALGMRGTQSVPMELDVLVPTDQVFEGDTRSLVLRSFLPVGHVGWSSVWFGAARGALKNFVAFLRRENAVGRAGLGSDLLIAQIGRIRLDLDLVASLIESITRRVDAWRSASAPSEVYEQPSYLHRLNNLKVAAAERCWNAVNTLIETAGLRGYLDQDELGLERVLRDIRSAHLMFNNRHLVHASGKLAMFEKLGAEMRW